VATSTSYTTFQKLIAQGNEAVLIVKLMMAFNDLALANEGLSIFQSQYATKRSDKSRGAAMYFVRLQAGHLYEAMEIVDAIVANQRLRAVIKECSEKAKTAFKRLVTLRRDKDQKRKFEQFVGRLRNNVTFHYDKRGDLIRRAMAKRAKDTLGNSTSITRGTERYSWRFTVADDVVDSIVCREIWKIPDAADRRAEADAAAHYGHQIFVDFADFASELIVGYVRDGA
jgi:hypothetical protein